MEGSVIRNAGTKMFPAYQEIRPSNLSSQNTILFKKGMGHLVLDYRSLNIMLPLTSHINNDVINAMYAIKFNKNTTPNNNEKTTL